MLASSSNLLDQVLDLASHFGSVEASKKLAAAFCNFVSDPSLQDVVFTSLPSVFASLLSFKKEVEAKEAALGDSISPEEEEDLGSCKKYVEEAIDGLVKKGLVESRLAAAVASEALEDIIDQFVISEREREEKEAKEAREAEERRVREEKERIEVTRKALEVANLVKAQEEKEKREEEEEAEKKAEEGERKAMEEEKKAEEKKEPENKQQDEPQPAPMEPQATDVLPEIPPAQPKSKVSRMESKQAHLPTPPPSLPRSQSSDKQLSKGLTKEDLERHNKENAAAATSAPPPSKKPHHPPPKHRHHHHYNHAAKYKNDPMMKVRLSSKIPDKPLVKFTEHDVASLLYCMKMNRYIKEVVLKNQIDGETLGRVADSEDLKEIGITISLHAKKVRRTRVVEI